MVEQLPFKEMVVGPTPTGRTMSKQEQPQLPKVPDNFEGAMSGIHRVRLPDGKETTVHAFSDDGKNWFFRDGEKWVPIIVEDEQKR